MAEPIRTVLLVDDDDDIRTIGELALRDVGGWTVVSATDGQSAFDLAQQHNPDVILLDVMMPGMDGPQTFRRLRASGAAQQTPIIFMTAKVQSHERAAYLALGAVGVVAKPFDPLTLPDTIRGLVRAEAQ